MLPPDKYDPMTSHLCISIKFWIGGKRPLLIGPCELSKRHKVLDVIKYILTLYRQKQDMKDKVQFKNDETPEAFDLRHPEDDGSDSDDNYEADTDIPALDHNQNIGEFDALVLVQKRNYRGPVVTNKEYNFKQSWSLEPYQQTFYVIIECIPMPLMLKVAKSMVIPMKLDSSDPIKVVFKQLT